MHQATGVHPNGASPLGKAYGSFRAWDVVSHISPTFFEAIVRMASFAEVLRDRGSADPSIVSRYVVLANYKFDVMTALSNPSPRTSVILLH
jgi:hypothetical protein